MSDQNKLIKTNDKTFTPIELILVILFILEIITSYIMFPIVMCIAKEALIRFILFSTINISITAILCLLKYKK